MLLRYAEDTDKDNDVIWLEGDELIPAEIDVSLDDTFEGSEDPASDIPVENVTEEAPSAPLAIERYQFETLVIAESGHIYLPIKAEAGDDDTMRISVNMIVKEGKTNNTYPLLTNYADSKWKKYKDPINYVAYVRRLAYAWYKKYAADYLTNMKPAAEQPFKPVKTEYKDLIDGHPTKTTVITDKYSTGYIAVATIQGPSISRKDQSTRIHESYSMDQAPTAEEIQAKHQQLYEQLLDSFQASHAISEAPQSSGYPSTIIVNDQGGLSKLEIQKDGRGYSISLTDGILEDKNFVEIRPPSVIPVATESRALNIYKQIVDNSSTRKVKNKRSPYNRSLFDKLVYPKETFDYATQNMADKANNSMRNLGDKLRNRGN